MGRKLAFVPGSFYRTDDRTGFVQRAERTLLEWNGLMVDQSVYEPRQPQDFVKGVQDRQSVPDARPLAPNVFVGPFYVQLTAAAVIGQTVLQVETTRAIQDGVRCGVMTDEGADFNTTVAAIGTGTITLAAPLTYPAANGNLVTIYRTSPGIFP